MKKEREGYMKRSKENVRRISTVLLSLLLCITFMPAGAFAVDESDVQGSEPLAAELSEESAVEEVLVDETAIEEEQPDSEPAAEEAAEENEYVELAEPETQETGEVVTPQEESQEEPQPAPVDPGPRAKSFTHDDVKVRFESEVVQAVPDFMKNAKPGRVWIKGYKSSIRVNWINAKNISNLSTVDGVIVLRATGKSKIFKEVKRVAFKKEGDTILEAKTYFSDKSVSKNTGYTYRVVSYYVKDGFTFISHISDWAAGQTSASKLKNVYTASINKETAKLQYKGTVSLKLTVTKPKTKYQPTSVRWHSDDKSIASVSSKGKVTAKGLGSTTIYGRLASGSEIACDVTVVGAFKPAAPKLSVDYATDSTITLVWNSKKYATSYDVYKSNDGLHWDSKPVNVKGTTHTFKGLTKGHRYTFYVIARNDNSPYSAESSNSNVVNQKAVVKLRATDVTGFPSKKSIKAGSTLKVTVKVTFPESRKASLQMRKGKKWTTKKTVKLPKGTGTSKVSITFPDDWWSGKTEWRLYIPKNKTASEYTTGTLKITAERRYQNPKSYVQIKDSIGKHGYSHYVSPVRVNAASTMSDHIEALITTAKKYKGDKYVQSRSGAPGKGIDESGLVMQSCYGAGVDLWPISPSTRPYNCVPKIMSSKLKKINYVPAAEGSNNYTTMTRGDLIFFASKKNGTPIHVAIYLGLGDIIHADPVKGNVNISTIRKLEDQNGSYKYYVVGVRRIFN